MSLWSHSDAYPCRTVSLFLRCTCSLSVTESGRQRRQYARLLPNVHSQLHRYSANLRRRRHRQLVSTGPSTWRACIVRPAHFTRSSPNSATSSAPRRLSTVRGPPTVVIQVLTVIALFGGRYLHCCFGQRIHLLQALILSRGPLLS